MCLIRSTEKWTQTSFDNKRGFGLILWSPQGGRSSGLVWFNVSTVSRMYLSFCVGLHQFGLLLQLCGSEMEGIPFLLVEWEKLTLAASQVRSFFLRCPKQTNMVQIPADHGIFFSFLNSDSLFLIYFSSIFMVFIL